MASPIDPITAVANAFTKLADVIGQYIAGSATRKMKRAIEYGERYIRLSAPLIDKIEDNKAKAELKEIEEDFFKNN